MKWMLLTLPMLAFGTPSFELIDVERPRIMEKAARYMLEAPRTLTATPCERSKGGPHDFYSEGDYWWPNPSDPDGPYIKDKLTWPLKPDVLYWNDWLKTPEQKSYFYISWRIRRLS